MSHPASSHPLEGKEPGYRVLDVEWSNAGPPPSRLALDAVTPVSRFFARNHGAIPAIDAAAYRLAVTGLVRRALALSLTELRERLPRREVPATLVCAGLRRAELVRHRPVPGELLWDLEPAGTAIWGGYALRDVLELAGVGGGAAHVGLVGLDQVERHGHRMGFGGSLPLAKALAPEVLLADTMNGAPLTPLHGAPIRLVVPGFIGARSVKWLGALELRAEPSDNYFQTHAYRVLSEPDPADPRNVARGEPLSDVVLQSVILGPEAGEELPAGRCRVHGWAMGGRASLGRVELSFDGGTRWAEVAPGEDLGPWAWRRWSAEVVLPPGPTELVVRAWDVTGQGQPATTAEVWNVKGYANNAWHRVQIQVVA